MSDTKQEIRKFVVDHFLFGEDNDLANDASLLEQGVIDSTGVLELVSHIESRYGCKVKDEELTPENLDSISRIADYLQRKRSQPTAS
jgi:acyl carrier protein